MKAENQVELAVESSHQIECVGRDGFDVLAGRVKRGEIRMVALEAGNGTTRKYLWRVQYEILKTGQVEAVPILKEQKLVQADLLLT